MTDKVIFKRKLYDQLVRWKNSADRKPLIIRGARQVGKSTLIKEFGKEFRYFINLNLEKEEDKKLFTRLNKPSDIINAVFIRKGIPLTDHPTMIFIDEIQESPEAIKMLRYFYEEFPGLYIVAAGSLLEFAMKKVASFPVGRVRQLVLHPFDFEEFLMATGRNDLLKELENIPLNKYAHGTLLDLFHDYAIIGGMPEVVRRYVIEGNMTNLQEVFSNLWQSYRDDVEKYASNPTERKIIRHIVDTAPFEKDRITMNGFGNSNYRSREVGEALRSLDLARVIQLVYPATATQPPAVPNLTRKPRLQFVDTGLLNISTGLQDEMIGLDDLNNFHRGKIIQHLVFQQVQAQSNSPLYKPLFWVREKANSNAEVDLVIQFRKYLIPVEIKSGGHGTLRSLHQFLEQAGHPYGIRLLANDFSVEPVKTPSGVPYYLMNLPYYAASKLLEYIKWFIEKFPIP